MTNDFGPLFNGRAAYHQRHVPGQLVHGISVSQPAQLWGTHRATLANTRLAQNGLFRMPLADPGKLTQLGGEFIIGQGHECEFAHRMTTTSGVYRAFFLHLASPGPASL